MRRRRLAWLMPLAVAFVAIALFGLAIGRRTSVAFSLFGHAVELGRLRALYLLGGLPLFYALLGRSLVDLPRAQQRVNATVRAVFVALLILALARPSMVAARQTVALVALVDVSDSISDRQLDGARTLVEQLRQARTGDHLLRLVTFGRQAHLVELPPDGTPLGPLVRHDRDGSDLQGALQLAYGLFPPGTLRRTLLISDGNETEGNLAAEAFGTRDRQVRVDTSSFPTDPDDEVLVRSLRVSSDIKLGAPFDVSAEIYSSRPGPATLTLYRDEFVNPIDGRKEVQLLAGANTVHWKSEVVNPGFTTFKAVVAPHGRDHFAGNNQASVSVSVSGKPRILYVEGEPAAASYLAKALRKENLDVEVRSAYGLPSNPKELARFDLLLLSDVPAQFVGPSQLAAIESYVRDLGGGFIMAGGENSFGSGGWSGSKMEGLLPVRFDTEKKRDQPLLALVLAIDRSGSMNGEKMELAKDAAKATAELLGADDLLSVVAFDSQAIPIVRMQRAANRSRIVSDISRLMAGGGTNILPALRLAFEELDPTAAKVKHVILLTDGQASYDGIRELVDEMQNHHITISAVGVGAEADKTLLTTIAERGGGRFYFTQDAQNIPKIFTKETSQVARSTLIEEAVGVHVVKQVELLDGVGMANAPPLRGYVATRPKPMSEVILQSDRSEPILARWRIGLGQAVAFTSDVKNRWAVDWLKWPGYPKFWAHLVRSTMRHSPGQTSGSGASFDLQVEVDPPRAHVVVDAVAADDKFLNGLESRLTIIDPEQPKQALDVPLLQTAAGRYEGDFAPPHYGSFLLRAIHRQQGVEIGESAGTLALPYPRELLALPPDESLLRRVAETTGGHYRPSATELFDPAHESVTWNRELQSIFLWLAALLLLVDVALRRVRLFR